jgi:hypothetical protein
MAATTIANAVGDEVTAATGNTIMVVSGFKQWTKEMNDNKNALLRGRETKKSFGLEINLK